MLYKKYCSKTNIPSIRNNQEVSSDFHNAWDSKHCKTLEKDSSNIESDVKESDT